MHDIRPAYKLLRKRKWNCLLSAVVRLGRANYSCVYNTQCIYKTQVYNRPAIIAGRRAVAGMNGWAPLNTVAIKPDGMVEPFWQITRTVEIRCPLLWWRTLWLIFQNCSAGRLTRSWFCSSATRLHWFPIFFIVRRHLRSTHRFKRLKNYHDNERELVTMSEKLWYTFKWNIPTVPDLFYWLNMLTLSPWQLREVETENAAWNENNYLSKKYILWYKIYYLTG